ncbi:hypothetical protein [Pseudonocardia sp. HH130629-09]|uniref:hypothetical protein n=1 Tax=Pseudonocardia sp. HH130629-09 TaxID=1641402 RepID=UPI0011AEB5C4|nr:hypothetical protein [Pseudonocardia sp. HH130629-09]
MTLILSCLTHKFAVQASDRQLTYLDGKVAEDASNKATLYCNQAVFAFTGLGSVSRTEKTRDFLRTTLAHHGQPDLQQMLNYLCAEATAKVQQLRLDTPRKTWPHHKRISFVGIGFIGGEHPTDVAGMPPTHDNLFPFFSIASNAQSGVSEEWRRGIGSF